LPIASFVLLGESSLPLVVNQARSLPYAVYNCVLSYAQLLAAAFAFRPTSNFVSCQPTMVEFSDEEDILSTMSVSSAMGLLKDLTAHTEASKLDEAQACLSKLKVRRFLLPTYYFVMSLTSFDRFA
jgi:hypothetical protein